MARFVDDWAQCARKYLIAIPTDTFLKPSSTPAAHQNFTDSAEARIAMTLDSQITDLISEYLDVLHENSLNRRAIRAHERARNYALYSVNRFSPDPNAPEIRRVKADELLWLKQIKRDQLVRVRAISKRKEGLVVAITDAISGTPVQEFLDKRDIVREAMWVLEGILAVEVSSYVVISALVGQRRRESEYFLRGEGLQPVRD